MAIERKAIYAFHARTAPSFSKGRVFLAGDAAHITPPFAGQGMMAGLRDAQNLAWKLAAVVQNKFSSDLLQSYTAERLPHTKQVINFARMIGHIVLPQQKLPSALRNLTIKLLTMVGWYTKARGAKLERISNHINGSPLLNYLTSRTTGTGVWIPQHIISLNGKKLLLDAAIPNTFCLISWHKPATDFFAPQTLARWRAFGGIESTISSQPTCQQLADVTGAYQEYFLEKPIVLVRPDKMVVLRCRWSEVDNLLNRYLDNLPICDSAKIANALGNSNENGNLSVAS